jgi:PHD/YefM family antitoxin component YafN of YafNO toxin-antitoxin module
MPVVTANELKTKGVSGIDKMLEDAREVIISVRGKPRYVVMEIDQYELMREGEIEAAWYQARSDVAAGRFHQESADEHIARITAELADEL